MDTAALQLCSRFAYSPNKLGYCGRNSAQQVFYDCIVHGKCDRVREEVTKFKGLYPYLKTIAEVLNKDWLDYEVVEAYWLGNDQLKKFKPEHYEILVKNLAAQGLPDFFIAEIARNKPKAFIPLHLFNVLHIGVGKITGSVPFNLENINNCMVRWGEVISTGHKSIKPLKHENNKALKHQVRVKLKSLVASRGGPGDRQIVSGTHKGCPYNIIGKDELIKYMPEFLPDLRVGSIVAVHWGWVVKVLEEKEVNRLGYWTNEVLSHII